MSYIVTKRFKTIDMGGRNLNLKYGTECHTITKGNMTLIAIDDKPICVTTSQNAHDYFSRNDDGKGLERGKLIQTIKTTLAKKDKNHQVRWDRLWDSDHANTFRRREHGDQWIWSHDFYNADISDLELILKTLKGEKQCIES